MAFFLVIALLASSGLAADEIRVAAASNFKAAMSELAQRFEEATGHDVILIFGLGNDASMVGANAGPTQLASAPVYGKIRNGKYDYGRYLLAYNVGPAGAEFGTAKLQVVLNTHGDFVDEMITEHLGQKQ